MMPVQKACCSALAWALLILPLAARAANGGDLGNIAPTTRPAAAAPLLSGLRFEGLVTLTEPAVAHHLGLENGARLTDEALDRALRRLWATGLIDDVELTVEPAGSGRAKLAVTLTERPLLLALRFEGLDRLTRSQIREWMRQERVGPEIGAAVDRPALLNLRRGIEDLTAAGGRRLDVGYRLVPAGPSSVIAVFHAAPARRGDLLAEVVFEGAQAIPAKILRKTLTHNKPASAMVGLTGRGRFDERGLEADRKALARLYHDRGFKDATVGEPRVTVLENGGGRLRLTIPIREGEHWTLGGLSVTGNRAASDQSLLALYPREGETLSLSAVESWIAAIRDLYFARGRIDTRIERELRERPGRKVDVIARVSEGPVRTLGRLTIVGNHRTADPVLRRELGVDEGETLDLPAIERGLAALAARGLFAPAARPITVAADADAGSAINLVLTGSEADPFRIDFGGGWSESDGISGHLALEARNLLGRGAAAGLRFAEGEIRDRLELYYSDPRFRGRDQTAAAELFDRGSQLSLPDDQLFQRQERGWRLAWSRPLGPRQHLRLSWTRSAIDDLQVRSGTDAARREVALDRASWSTDWLFDSRDHPLETTRGLRAQLTLAASGGALGGDQDLLESRAALSWFQPLPRRAVLALRLGAGAIEPRGQTRLAPLDTYFLGGPRSVRGFATGTIVARDESGTPLTDETGFVTGGNRFLEGGLELRVPLRDPFAAALFVDFGQVWADGQSIDLGDPRASAGAELWLRLPRLGLPVRLVWAHNLDPLPGEDFDSFLVGFGASF